MRGDWIQLWVERLAMDPAAATAAHALQLLLGQDAPVRVGRADLWELEAEDAGDGAAARFEGWLRGSNLFLNPNRDRGVLLDGIAPVPGPSAASVVTIERGAADSRAHALTLGHALGGRWRVRRGTVWTLLWAPERADDVPVLADKAAWARRRSSGLLVNSESQDARVLVGEWANPALPGAQVEAPVVAPDKDAAEDGGDDGQVA